MIRVSVLCLFLAGCATVHKPPPVEQQTIVKMEYVMRIPPKELLTIPPEVPNINVDNALQSDVAKWITLNETRMNQLEDMIKNIARFFKKEQDTLDKKAKDQ